MSPEKARKKDSFLRLKKKLFEENNFTCQKCFFSIRTQIEEFSKIEIPISKNKIKVYHECRSLILSQIQIHHIQPLSQNGTNDINNLICICERCHNEIHELESKKYFENKENRKFIKAKVILKKDYRRDL